MLLLSGHQLIANTSGKEKRLEKSERQKDALSSRLAADLAQKSGKKSCY